MTSQHDKHGRSMSQLLEGAEGSPDEIVEMILLEINKMFDDKRVVVRCRNRTHRFNDISDV